MSGFLCSMVGVSAVAAVAEVIRKKKGIIANGNAQIDTAQSKFGGASALFDGTADYLLINPITDFSFEANNFTIEGWFRFNDSSTRIMFDTRPATTQGWYPTIYWISSTVRLYLNGGDRINSSGLSLSTWYHIALVRSGADYKLYINGTQSGSTYTDSTSLSAGQVVLGADAYSLGSSSFNGHIDEFRISNTARYTTTFTPSTTPFTNDDNTLLLLHMNGTDASTYFEDDNGVRYKNSVVAQGNAQLDTAQSKFGGSSLLLDGTGDFTRTPVIGSTFSFGTGDFTIEAWARANSLGGDNKLFGGDTNNDFFFGRYSGKWSVGKVGVSAVIDATSSVSTGTWYHMAISRSSGTTKIFQNGTQIASASDTYGWKFTNYFQLGAEGSGTSTTWNGWVDEVRVSNTARYTANFTAPTTPFVNDENTLLLLHMNGTDASTYFEDDNGVRDQKAIAAYGNAQIDTAQSKFGGTSLALDGTGDYLTVAKTDDMNVGSGDFTVEAWVRLTSNSADSFIVCGNGSGGFFFGFRPGSTAVGYGRSAVAWDYSPTVTVTTGTWTHWAVCRSGTSIRLFKDGTQFGTTQTSSQSYNFAVTTLMAIGGEYNNGSPQLYLNGWIDELRISNSARYTANFTAPTTPFTNDTNTLLLLHMDGTDALTVFRDDNGTGRASKGIYANGNAQLDTAQSKFGGSSLLLDGTGDFTRTPSVGSDFTFGTGDFTIEAWVRANSLGGDNKLFGGDTNNDFFFGRYSGKWSVGKVGVSAVIDATSSVSTGTWYHMAISRSSGTTKIFQDGTQIASASDTYGWKFTNYFQLGAEGSGTSTTWNGWIDEVRVSNTARYTANFTAPTAPFQNDANTLLLMHCDGTDGSTVFTDDNGKTPT